MSLKKHVIDFLCSRPVQSFINPRLKYNAVIFMLHRFTSENLTTHGHDPELLAECIAYLKSNGRNIVSLDELFLSLTQQSDPIENAVVFTVDDGFLDQAEVCAQTFKNFTCPVTVCIVNQLISQTYWLAESRIAYILESTCKPDIEFYFNQRQFNFEVSNSKDRFSAIKELVFYCKSLPLDKVEQLICILSTELKVEVPNQAPVAYRGMDWQTVRALEGHGVTFCAHTETHPALSAESDERSRKEILESFQDLKCNTSNPSRVFCYPTGRPNIDYTDRDIQYVEEAGFVGALSSIPGYVDLTHRNLVNVFSVPRFSFPDNMLDFKQVVHHLEFIKDQLR